MNFKALIAVIAVAMTPFAASAATTISSGVTGGCTADAYAGGIGKIDVAAGGGWTTLFDDGDAGGSCFFNLENNDATDKKVVLTVSTVNQGGNAWGFTGGVDLSSFTHAAANVHIPEGDFWSESITLIIAAGSFAAFDWSWGEAYSNTLAPPFINFSVATVPLPAGGLLLLGGLGGIAALRRKKA